MTRPPPRPDLIDCPLSTRQLVIMRARMHGVEYNDLAVRFNVSLSTIRSTLHEGRIKMGLKGAPHAEVYQFMLSRGWLVDGEVLAEGIYSTWLTATKADWDWTPSPAQRLYLTAFDRLLRCDRAKPKACAVSGAAADLAFRLMCWESNRKMPLPSFNPNAVADRVDAMLLTIARGVMREF